MCFNISQLKLLAPTAETFEYFRTVCNSSIKNESLKSVFCNFGNKICVARCKMLKGNYF